MLVSVSAFSVENLISDPDSLLDHSDKASYVVELSFFENSLLARALVKHLNNISQYGFKWASTVFTTQLKSKQYIKIAFNF